MTTPDFLSRLTAGLAEEERIAHWSTQGPARLEYDWEPVMYEHPRDGNVETVADSSGVFIAEGLGRTSDHVARQDPASTLRRAEAMRKVLRRYEEAERDSVLSDRDAGFEAGMYAAIEALADIYPEDTGQTEES
ncbi:DUF6221 family protein [Nocardia sp. NBC_01388]|uniref:DUF6221 family protein n=1 Tax=Nocardia sp. NBC_01388 TaxID=2903596 RepID=UPI00324C6AB8